jgi:hypothetical protein
MIAQHAYFWPPAIMETRLCGFELVRKKNTFFHAVWVAFMQCGSHILPAALQITGYGLAPWRSGIAPESIGGYTVTMLWVRIPVPAPRCEGDKG